MILVNYTCLIGVCLLVKTKYTKMPLRLKKKRYLRYHDSWRMLGGIYGLKSCIFSEKYKQEQISRGDLGGRGGKPLAAL